MGGARSTIGGEEECIYVKGKLKGKRQLGRPSPSCVDNIEMDLGEIGWGGGYWIGVAQYRDIWRALANAVMNLSCSINCWEVIEWLHNWCSLK
jgi:hypothetical protein